MARVLIIGYGNPLRGDDGLGWHAAEALAAQIDDPEIEVRPVHQLTPELADPLSQAEMAIFIDASSEGEPGTIERRPISPEDAANIPATFTHHAGPAILLATALTLYGHAPETVLYTVAAESMEIGDRLTATVEEAMRKVVAEVARVAGARVAARGAI
jgi:hydrogenase maturation protease